MKTLTQITGSSIAALLFTLSACSKIEEDENVNSDKNSIENMMRENNNNPDEAIFNRPPAGRNDMFVYTMSNDPGTNDVHMYRKNSVENLEFMGKRASGGAGNGLSLGSQGALQVDAGGNFLYAVNAGSKSISSFRIANNGLLTLKSTVYSGGTTPVSLAIYGNFLYVVHSGDGTINGFRLGQNGTFSHISGSEKSLSSPSAGPAQISFSPNGRYLYVTEKTTDKISIFSVSNDGVAGERTSITSVGKTPFGFNFARDSYMIVSNAENGAANLSTITSYIGADTGYLTVANGAVPNYQTAACWIATTLHGRYAFVSNTGSDTLSSLFISPEGNVYTIEQGINTGDAPSDIVVGSDNYNVYVLCSLDHTIQIYRRDELGGIIHTGKVLNLPQSAAGLATSL